MNKRLFSLMALLTIVGLVLAACGPAATEAPAEPTEAMAEEPAAEEPMAEGGLMMGMDQAALEAAGYVVYAPGDPIRIGISSGLTGPIPDLGQDTANGALLAIDDLNAAGGYMGHNFEADLQDGACDGDQGTNVGNLFASDPSIVAVQGGLCTGETLGLRSVLQDARIPFVSASATNPAVTGEEWDTANRVVLSDALQGDVDADYVYNQLGITKVALMNDSGDYGVGLADLFGAAFEALGGEVTSTNGIQVGDTDFRAVLTQIAAEGPELIFFGGYATEAGLIASQMGDVGLGDVVFMTGDGAFTDQYLQAAGAGGEGSYVTTPVGDVNAEAEADFNAKYAAAFGYDPAGPYHLNAYDAVSIMAQAIQSVAQEDEAGEGYLIISRDDLIAAIHATSGYAGLTGTITCSAIGDCGAGGIQIFQVVDGAFSQVYGFGLE